MPLFLVRHAKAGSRSDFDGDDFARPLTGKGRRQALAIAEQLGPHAIGKLISSPFVRCVQTLQPLAERRGTTVATNDTLAEGAGFGGVVELLATLPDGSVLCSHGDVIPETMAALERRGCVIVGEPDWRKATVWRLQRSDDGTVLQATVTPPPDRR